jgi:hypothetical protein
MTGAPPDQLLMRMALYGGEFSSHSGGTNWIFPTTKNGKQAYQGQFASVTTWTKEIKGRDALTLRLIPFGSPGSEGTPFTLRPVNGVVKLTICNLCAENPVEWPELRLRAIAEDKDKDFKWLYRLIENADLALKDHNGNPQQLPVPELDHSNMVAGEERDCAGGEIVVNTW